MRALDHAAAVQGLGHGFEGMRKDPHQPIMKMQFGIKSGSLPKLGLEDAGTRMGICPAKLQISISFPKRLYL